MKNYYDVLGIERDADERQIKSAYFKAVRKYPPERFPEEFKQIRAAYETLSDAESRKEYDRIGDIPYEAAYLYDQVQKARRERRHSDATDILKMIVKWHPSLQNIKVELARSYEYENKPGKAIKVWEELCQLDPANSFYSYELALSYENRGWRKKAIEYYEKTVTLEPGKANAWRFLIGCHKVADEHKQVKERTLQALEAVTEIQEGVVLIYAFAFDYYIQAGDKPVAESYLTNIINVLKSGENYTHNEVELALQDLLNSLFKSGNEDMLPYLLQMAELTPDFSSKTLDKLKSAAFDVKLNALEREGYPGVLLSILHQIETGCDCQDCVNDMLAMEASILYDIQGYRPYLVRLKDEHPDLYAMHFDFFSEALVTHNHEKLFYTRIKKLERQSLEPLLKSADGSKRYYNDDESDADPVEQVSTYRREGPKIGRNDPCPCGSGKKYKKCCGR